MRWSVVKALLIISILLISGSLVTESVAGQEETTERAIDVDTNEVEIYLQSQKTVIRHDETAIFTYSATNYVTNEEELTVQLILQAPSGSEVFSSGNVEEGSGSQFTTTTKLDPGEQESIRIHVDLNEPGEHELTGQAIYFFGNNRESGDGIQQNIYLQQQPRPPSNTERILSFGSDLATAPSNLYDAIASTAPRGSIKLGPCDSDSSGCTPTEVSKSSVIVALLIFLCLTMYGFKFKGLEPTGSGAWIIIFGATITAIAPPTLTALNIDVPLYVASICLLPVVFGYLLVSQRYNT
jgi:hypothetical protein